MTSLDRTRLERSLGQDLGRELSARTILFHQALATLAGVSPTDLKCLDYISRSETTTAGDLARITGLSTGSITAAIDRLEAASLAFRERDGKDRRKVFLRIGKSPNASRLLPLYEALAADMTGLLKRYTTPELLVVEDYMSRSIEILQRHTERVTSSTRRRLRPPKV